MFFVISTIEEVNYTILLMVKAKLCFELFTDVNMAVAVEAIQAIGNLAWGLQTHFSGSSHFFVANFTSEASAKFLQNCFQDELILLENLFHFLILLGLCVTYEVEGLQDLDQSVEIFICLLCAIPGWNEKNVQVQQQVIEVVTYLASSATRFPKKCVVLCLLGISERVADIKTRAHAMKCLTTFG
ncbi:hypothetical protein REPUB_Repub04eG0266100 [Reevesia pubescens]